MSRREVLMSWLVPALACLGCSAALCSEPATTPGGEAEGYLQAWLGALETDDGWSLEQPESGPALVGDLGTLPFGGGAAQWLWGGGRLRFGYESGGLTSWKNHDTEFFAASTDEGGTLLLSTDNTFFAIGVFIGGVASLDLTRHLRLQLAAGPSLTWARLDGPNEPDEPTPQLAAVRVVDVDDASHDVSFIPYGRVGLEVLLDNGFTFGVSARYADDEFDFGGNGELEVDEVVWLLTIGSRL
jgi:hypothetical protein